MKKKFSLFKDGTAKKGFLDIKFKKHYLAFLIQAFFGGLLIAVCIGFLDIILGFIDHSTRHDPIRSYVIGSIAASTFLVFGAPHLGSSKPEKIFFGHLISVLIGVTIFFVFWGLNLATNSMPGILVAGLLSVSLAILLMTVLNYEHPPAAGTALALATHNMQDTLFPHTHLYSLFVIALFVLAVAFILSAIRGYFYCEGDHLKSIEGLGGKVQTALNKAKITSITELCKDVKRSKIVLLSGLEKDNLYEVYCKKTEIAAFIDGWIAQAQVIHKKKKKRHLLINLF